MPMASGYGMDDSLDTLHESNAEADRLWWVDVVRPDGVIDDTCGGGTSRAEATAVAWIITCLGAWWQHPSLSDDDYAKVPRLVPEGWQFELCVNIETVSNDRIRSWNPE